MSASGVMLFQDFVFNEPEDWAEDLVHEFRVKKNTTVLDVWIQSVNGNVWNGTPNIQIGDEDDESGYCGELDVTEEVMEGPYKCWNSTSGSAGGLGVGTYTDNYSPFNNNQMGKRYSEPQTITMTLHRNDDDGNDSDPKGQLFVRIVYITPTVPKVK